MVQIGAQVVYSKYAGTELEFNDADHLILKEDDIIGILDSDDVKDLKPLNDRILIKVCLPRMLYMTDYNIKGLFGFLSITHHAMILAMPNLLRTKRAPGFWQEMQLQSM